MSGTRFDVNKLTKVRSNLYFLSLRLLGLTPIEKETVDIPRFYKVLFGKRLKDDIHHELDQMKLHRAFNVNQLSVQLADELIDFAKSLSNEDIENFFKKVINDQVSKLNIGGTVLLLKQYQKEASSFFSNQPVIQESSSQAWDELIAMAMANQTLLEKSETQDLNKGRNILITLLGLLPICFAAGAFLINEEEDREKFLEIVIHSIVVRFIFFISYKSHNSFVFQFLITLVWNSWHMLSL